MHSLFHSIKNAKQEFLAAKRGGEFEDRIRAHLRNSMRYAELRISDIKNWSTLKNLILEKSNESPILNSYGVNHSFIFQPNGTQNYPDFLVFWEKEVVCIETKFAKPARPVWNSGLPRPNGFYILGSPATGCGDITFFRGCDVVSAEEARHMHYFFDEMRAEESKFNKTYMNDQSKGFGVYVRKAFQQGKQYNQGANTDFYRSTDRSQLEENVVRHFSATPSV